MREKETLQDKLRRRFYKEREEGMDSFLDWLIEQRLDYLARNGDVTSEDAAIAKLTAELTKTGQKCTASEKTCLALFVDQVEHEKQMVYQQGLLDGITLMKAIRRV